MSALAYATPGERGCTCDCHARVELLGQQLAARDRELEKCKRQVADLSKKLNEEQACGAQQKLSALAIIIQNPALSHKQARTRAGTVLAIEAQRPPENPRAAFRVDLGDLAKRAGLIPPTPEGDEEARRKAWKSGRKQAGQALQELENAGAFEEYRHEREWNGRDEVTSSSVIVRTSAPHVELIRIAGRMNGTRKLQQPRHHNGSRPYCQECGPDAPVIERTTRQCFCGGCGQALTEPETTNRELHRESDGFRGQEGEPADGTSFQSMETLCNEDTGGEVTCFQSLETGEAQDPEPPAPIEDLCPEVAAEGSVCPAVQVTDPPAELRSKPQWVAYGGDKVPIDPSTDRGADPTDPRTWATHEEAWETAVRLCLFGAGYMFNRDETGIDLDHCRDPVTGEIQPWAWAIVTLLDSYTEVSLSGEGLHLIVRGTKPGERCVAVVDGHKIEMYDSGRYFAMTGRHLVGTPTRVEERCSELEALYRRVFPDPPPSLGNGHARDTGSLDDHEIVARANSARNGAKFGRLWRGDWVGYPSQSEADLALCRLLAFWGADASQVDRLFRQSGLYRGKWDERHHGNGQTYGERTVEVALGRVS